MAQNISILTPLAYIFVMITTFVVFSVVYRRRKVRQLSNIKPIYDLSFARDNYFYVKALFEENGGKGSNKKQIPDTLIESALVRWAENDIRQIVKMKQSKEVLTQIHQKGFISDATYTKFITSEKALELEVQEIVREAEEFRKGLGEKIFGLTTDISQADGIRIRVKNAEKFKQEYQERWDKIKAKALADLEKE